MPSRIKVIEVHEDVSFSGEWDSLNSTEATSVLSITGFIIKHVGSPLFWTSKLKTEISLSATEAEFIAMHYSMREKLPLMVLLKEIHGVFKIDEVTSSREVNCEVFEENIGCVELAKFHKLRPRTK